MSIKLGCNTSKFIFILNNTNSYTMERAVMTNVQPIKPKTFTNYCFTEKRLLTPVYTLSKVHHEKGCSDWTNYFKLTKSFVFFVEKFAFLSGNAPQPEYFKSHTGMRRITIQEGKIPAQY